jgi:hypothetical protein
LSGEEESKEDNSVMNVHYFLAKFHCRNGGTGCAEMNKGSKNWKMMKNNGFHWLCGAEEEEGTIIKVNSSFFLDFEELVFCWIE